MISRIDRYVASSMLSGTVLVMLLLLALFSFLALAEELEDVGEAAYRTADAFAVTALTLPKRMVELLPVTLLLGGLVGLGGLANNLELLALRAAGFSPRRIAWPALQVGIVLGLTVLALQTYGIPVWEAQAAQLRSKATVDNAAANEDEAFWTRTGDSVVHVRRVLFGRSPQDIEIYQLDAKGNLAGIMQAGSADLIDQDRWLLTDVRSTDFTESSPEEKRIPSVEWASGLSPDEMARLLTPIEALAPGDLVRYIRYLETNRLDTHQYRLVLWQQAGLPIAILAMCILGVPFVLGSTRAISAGQRVAIGGAIGIVFYLVEQVTGQMAALFQLSPAPAALLPDVLLLIVAVVLLFRLR